MGIKTKGRREQWKKKKMERRRRRRKRQMVWAVGEDACCLWGEGVSDCLCCSPQACVEAAVLSRCQTDLSHWFASVSSFPKREHNWGNWSQETCEGHLEEQLWWAADVHREWSVQNAHALPVLFHLIMKTHRVTSKAKIIVYPVEFVFVVQWFTSLITYMSLRAGDLSHKSYNLVCIVQSNDQNHATTIESGQIYNTKRLGTLQKSVKWKTENWILLIA